MTLCLLGPCLSTGDWPRSIPNGRAKRFPSQRRIAEAESTRPSHHLPERKDPVPWFWRARRVIRA